MKKSILDTNYTAWLLFILGVSISILGILFALPLFVTTFILQISAFWNVVGVSVALFFVELLILAKMSKNTVFDL